MTTTVSSDFAAKLKPVMMSGREVLPIVEGGKGVGASNGYSAGAFAAAGAVGTISAVNQLEYDADGKVVPLVYHGKTRVEKHRELVANGIRAGIQHAKIAHEISGGKGRIHMNILWEMGGAAEVMEGILEGAKGMVHGVTCGAGMPYRLSEIATKHGVYYHPIISSMRAFRALWKRSYSKHVELLGSVVYEDPWLAGGHNGLSNGEDPNRPEDPYPRIVELRKFMNEVGLHHVPIIMAGGAWHLKDFAHWLDNPDVGPIAFQFGTRPLLTKESPIPDAWKERLMTLKEGDVFLNQFSPTGFYSSAVNNPFIKELRARSERQIAFAMEQTGYLSEPMPIGPRGRIHYVTPEDKEKAEQWMGLGFTEAMKTPDDTLMFVTPEKAEEIHTDQVECMGCLSHCRFSNWKDHDDFTTGKKADPRSFCIQKTLQDVVRGGPLDENLVFSGHNAYKFALDPFYSNGFVPTVGELVQRIMAGE
jgi:nitronate monooxygenase